MASAPTFKAQSENVSKIFLVGMPGCGKSTVGKALAQQLHYTFLDLDTLIEEQEGSTVPAVFEQRGQEYFRQAEANALRQASLRQENIVLATGGGAPCFCDNMAFMVSHGTVIYLKVSPQELVDRLTETDLQGRPLLRDKTSVELLQYLSDTLAQREPFYAQALYAVEVGGKSVASIVQEVEQHLLATPDQVSGSI